MTDDSLPVLRSRTVPAVAPQPALEADAQLSVELKKAHVLARGGDAIPKSYRGNDAAILLAMDWAQKHDLDLVSTLQSVSFYNGKPIVDATMQRALVQRAGYRLTIETATDTESTVAIGDSAGTLIGRASFTLEEAKRANLLDKDVWKKWRSDMLVAGATRRAVRRYAPEVMLGLSLADVDDEVEVQRPLLPSTELQREFDPTAAEIVDPVVVDNGDSSAGTADTGSTPAKPISQAEAVRVTNLRTGIRKMINHLDDDGIAKLRQRMGDRKLDDLAGDELVWIQRLVTTLVPTDREEPTDGE